MPIFTTFNWMTLKAMSKPKKNGKNMFFSMFYIKLHPCLPVVYYITSGTPRGIAEVMKFGQNHRGTDHSKEYHLFIQPVFHPANDGMDGTFPPRKFQTQFPLKDWNGSKVKQNKQTNLQLPLWFWGFWGTSSNAFDFSKVCYRSFLFAIQILKKPAIQIGASHLSLCCTIGGASKSLESISTNSHLSGGVLPDPSSHQLI